MSRRGTKYQNRKINAESERGSTVTAAGNDIIPFHVSPALPPAKILDLFLENFKYILASDSLPEMIQVVKGELYNRDYISAFDSDDKRFAYVARWSPARALAYSALFASLEPIKRLFQDPEKSNRILTVGGGASSELVGMASVFCGLKRQYGDSASSLTVDVIDIADWTTIVGNLTSFIQKNWLYNPDHFDSHFVHGDVLTKSAGDLNLDQLNLITLLFTTNELFCEKRTETIRLLQSFGEHCKKGTLLLITESAGSYSNISVGLKQFPVQFLIDTVLVGRPGSDSGKWTIVDQSESCWYRVNDREVTYPVKLENMRFFYRLYERK